MTRTRGERRGHEGTTLEGNPLMAIAYHTRRPEARQWDETWKANELSHLLATARRDPLSAYLVKNLPGHGTILEGGCGLGQYVTYLLDRGYSMLGADFSLSALRVHRRAYPDSPLLALDLGRMPLADGVLQGHISLGVVEHLEDGPQDLLREFYRTLAPGGTLLLSVPWVNGYRRLTNSFIERKQSRLRATGAEFYQYAFTRGEIGTFLQRAGFQVRSFYPYSPAKGMREVPFLGRLYHRRTLHLGGRAGTVPIDREGVEEIQGLRRLLYWRPVLWLFSHMILAVAQKPES
jgi:SAM-dependent methyltransferase